MLKPPPFASSRRPGVRAGSISRVSSSSPKRNGFKGYISTQTPRSATSQVRAGSISRLISQQTPGSIYSARTLNSPKRARSPVKLIQASGDDLPSPKLLPRSTSFVPSSLMSMPVSEQFKYFKRLKKSNHLQSLHPPIDLFIDVGRILNETKHELSAIDRKFN
jgi:hypothetical protein